MSEGDALGFYLERVVMHGPLPEGAEGWKHLSQVSTDRAFCRKQIKILPIAVLFMLPFLPNRMHIKSKNRIDLQLGFVSSWAAWLPFQQNVQFHSQSQATVHLVQDGGVAMGEAEKLKTQNISHLICCIIAFYLTVG